MSWFHRGVWFHTKACDFTRPRPEGVFPTWLLKITPPTPRLLWFLALPWNHTPSHKNVQKRTLLTNLIVHIWTWEGAILEPVRTGGDDRSKFERRAPHMVPMPPLPTPVAPTPPSSATSPAPHVQPHVAPTPILRHMSSHPSRPRRPCPPRPLTPRHQYLVQQPSHSL